MSKLCVFIPERKIEDAINTCNGSILISDKRGFQIMLQSVLGGSRRVVQVAEGIVDGSCDAMYRNGLMVYVQKLKKCKYDF